MGRVSGLSHPRSLHSLAVANEQHCHVHLSTHIDLTDHWGGSLIPSFVDFALCAFSSSICILNYRISPLILVLAPLVTIQVDSGRDCDVVMFILYVHVCFLARRMLVSSGTICGM